MIVIILIAFCLIGLIGITIENRCILVVYAISMCLIMLASIIIYAVGTTNQSGHQPKMPYYEKITPSKQVQSTDILSSLRSVKSVRNLNQAKNRLNQSRIGMGINNNNRNDRDIVKRKIISKTRSSEKDYEYDASLDVVTKKNNNSKINLDMLSDYEYVHPDDIKNDPSSSDKSSEPTTTTSTTMATDTMRKTNAILPIKDSDIDDEDDLDDDDNRRVNPAWVAYENRLYEKYLDIISQSIDLILHSITAFWLALLLDEDSDRCFSGQSSTSNIPGFGKEPAPVYNYNGVRYSIKDSDAVRVLVK